MALYDDKHHEFLSILESQRFTDRISWEKNFSEWLDSKITSIRENGKNVSGNLLQPYLASMRYGSKEAMNLLMAADFNPTYQLLHKRLSILSEYVGSSDNLSAEILRHHLGHVSTFYSDIPEKQRERKVFDYVNQVDPFLGQDALINICARKCSSESDQAKITEKSIIDCVKVLISSGSDLTRSDRNNYMALHWAIIEGNSKVAISLIRSIEQDCLVAYNNSYETPLSLAAKNGQKEVVLSLLKKGVTCDGYILSNGSPSLPPNVRQRLNVQNPLLLSLQTGKIDVANDLVSFGAKFDATINQHDMHTALIYAVKHDNPVLFRNMLKNGHLPNQVNSHGFTPLTYLSLRLRECPSSLSAKSMIRDVLDHKGSLEVITKNGLSALDVLEGMAKNGDEFAMNVVYDRNVEKMIEFVSEASNLRVSEISDLHVNDEQLASMRTKRVESISSVWLNREMKTEEYRGAIIATGRTSFKDMAFTPFIAASSVYGILKGVGEYVEDKKDLPFHDYLALAVQNTEMVTAVCSVIAAGFMVYRTLSDERKKYALGYWLSDTAAKISKKYIDPLASRLESYSDERVVRIRMALDKVQKRLGVISQRVVDAVSVLSGKAELRSSVEDITDEISNTLEFPRRQSSQKRTEDPGDKMGLG